MLYRIIGFIICFSCQMTAWAGENQLLNIKHRLLPDNRVRMDFQFAQIIENPPVVSLTEKPASMTIDFLSMQSTMSEKDKMQPVHLGAIRGYQISRIDKYVRIRIDLKKPITWSSNMDGHQYTLIISNKSGKDFQSNNVQKTIPPLRHNKRQFQGKPVTLDFQKIQVNAVLQLLAEVAGTNIIVGSQAGSEEITLHLNEIPWDQALDIILTTQNLGMHERDNVIFVDSVQNLATKAIEDLKTRQEVSKQAPLKADLIQINYARAQEIGVMLKDKNTSLLSDRGTVSVDIRTNSLWIQDTRAQIKSIRALIKKLDVPVRQVAIESRIVTVDKDFTQDLGIRWGLSRAGGLESTTPLQDNLVGTVPFVDKLNLDLAALPVGIAPASMGLALAKLGEGILLDLELSALESESRGEVIASPRLITSNQQPATIESGTEIPYQEATSSGATAVSFKKAVLSLSVTPQITPDNKIMMTLKINQDRPGIVTNGIPAISTKQIQTNVLVNNGQTIVLGGIYQQDKKNMLTRIPFLGDLPIVGPLFRSKKVLIRDEELLIFITPKILTNSMSVTTA